MNKLSQDRAAQKPIFDLNDYLLEKPHAQEKLATKLRFTMENVGFYILVNHGININLIAETYKAAKQFHSQPLDAKMALTGNEHNVGYMALNSRKTGETEMTGPGRLKLERPI